jgi:hypothetical protein
MCVCAESGMPCSMLGPALVQGHMPMAACDCAQSSAMLLAPQPVLVASALAGT